MLDDEKELPPPGHPLNALATRLGELLDEDHWAECEDNERMNCGRVRKPRVRAQKLYCRFGGMPFLPMRIAHYPTPAFYYSGLMWHRRKQELDYGQSKIRNGLYRALSPSA